MELPEDSVAQKWFASWEQILKEFGDKALADASFNVIYNQEKASREQQRANLEQQKTNQRQEALLQENIRATRAATVVSNAASAEAAAAKRATRGW